MMQIFKKIHDEYVKTSKKNFIKRKKLRFEILELLQQIFKAYLAKTNQSLKPNRPDTISPDDMQMILQAIELFIKTEFGSIPGRDANLEKIEKAAAALEETGLELKNNQLQG